MILPSKTGSRFKEGNRLRLKCEIISSKFQLMGVLRVHGDHTPAAYARMNQLSSDKYPDFCRGPMGRALPAFSSIDRPFGVTYFVIHGFGMQKGTPVCTGSGSRFNALCAPCISGKRCL
jgi:hypothetical protein